MIIPEISNFGVNAVVLTDYIDWLKNILKLTGMSIGAIFLFLFIFWISINLLMALLKQIFPVINGIIVILEYLLLPGTLMHNVWHVFAAKKLNIPIEGVYNFGLGWSRTGIKLNRQLSTLKEGILFFWAPLLNIPVIILWVIPGMLLFQWFDTLLDGVVFYWIWLYILFSLVIFGLPDLADFINPLQITVIKTPEFYIFVILYVLIAPITLIFWGWGLTIILSLVYALIAFYEVQKIARKEENRLKSKYDKVFSSQNQPLVIITEK